MIICKQKMMPTIFSTIYPILGYHSHKINLDEISTCSTEFDRKYLH